MEALTIILLILTLVSVLFILFIKYKVNKTKKEEEVFNKINNFSVTSLENKSRIKFSSKRTNKNTSKETKNYHYIGGVDPVDDNLDRVIITSSSSDIYESDGFGNGGSFGGGGASGSWDSSSDSSSD